MPAPSASHAALVAADSDSELSAAAVGDECDDGGDGNGDGDGEDDLRDVHSASTTASDADNADLAASTRSSSPSAAAVSSSAELAARRVEGRPSFAYFACLLYAFAVMGFDMGLLGPSLLEMAAQVNGTIAAMSLVLAARSAGLLTGTLIAGYLIDRMPHRGNLLLLAGVASISGWTALFPFISNLYALVAAGWVHGLTMGLVDNTSQVLLIRHYGDQVGPYMQALHCAFGAGSLFSPLVLSPFLANTAAPTETLSDGTLVVYDVTFHWAWLIMAAVGLPCALWMAHYTRLHDFAARLDPRLAAAPGAAPLDVDCDGDGEAALPTSDLASGWHEAGQTASALSAADDKAAYQFQLRVVLNVGVFLSLYVGCETGYGSYIYSYAVTQLGVSADSGAYLNSGYWGSFTAGRFLGIFVSLYFSPQQMVLADLLGCLVAVGAILAFQSSFAALWLGTALYGLSVGSVYASAINYTERLVGVSGRLLSYLTFFAALGDAVVPLSIGSVFDSSVGGRAMMWLVLAVAAAATAVFAFLGWWVDRWRAQTSRAKLGQAREPEAGGGLTETETAAAGDGRADGGRAGRVRSGADAEQQEGGGGGSGSSKAGWAAAGKRRTAGYTQLPAQQLAADEAIELAKAEERRNESVR